MGDLSKNFSKSEFRCKCGECSPVLPPDELIEVMQHIREHFDLPVTVHSGHRCKDYNRRVGGASRSKHLTAEACDFTILGVSNDKIQEYVLNHYQGKYGIGRYNNFTHVDVRKGPARWDFR